MKYFQIVNNKTEVEGTTLLTVDPYIFCKASMKLDVEDSLDKINLKVSSRRNSLKVWS